MKKTVKESRRAGKRPTCGKITGASRKRHHQVKEVDHSDTIKIKGRKREDNVDGVTRDLGIESSQNERKRAMPTEIHTDKLLK